MTATNQPAAQDANSHVVTNPERITAVLHELRQQLVLVGVRIGTDGPLYNSLLVRLDPEQQLLYLDEINLFDAREQIVLGTEIHVYASLRGIAIHFQMTVERLISEENKQLYIGAYPKQIDYLQRRDVFRVSLPSHERRSVVLQHEYSTEDFTARLIDISVKGFCVGLLEGTLERSLLKTRFRYSGMELPGLRTPLSGHARFVNLRPSAHLGIVSAGFYILDLDPQTERLLMRAALYYQREARKLEFRHD